MGNFKIGFIVARRWGQEKKGGLLDDHFFKMETERAMAGKESEKREKNQNEKWKVTFSA